MHKYERLERYYYKKKIFKIVLIVFVILSVIGISLFFFINNRHKNTKKSISTKKTTLKEVTKKSKKVEKTQKIIKQKVQTVKHSDSNIKLSFVLPKIKIEEQKKVKLPKQKEVKPVKKILPHKKNLIIEEKMDIKDLINSFNKNPSYDVAIRISNYYLNHNNLALAKNWALKANNINPSKADSWEIFAIILVKQKNIQKAKEVLKIYLNDYGENPEITKLLRSLNDK